MLLSLLNGKKKIKGVKKNHHTSWIFWEPTGIREPLLWKVLECQVLSEPLQASVCWSRVPRKQSLLLGSCFPSVTRPGDCKEGCGEIPHRQVVNRCRRPSPSYSVMSAQLRRGDLRGQLFIRQVSLGLYHMPGTVWVLGCARWAPVPLKRMKRCLF